MQAPSINSPVFNEGKRQVDTENSKITGLSPASDRSTQPVNRKRAIKAPVEASQHSPFRSIYSFVCGPVVGLAHKLQRLTAVTRADNFMDAAERPEPSEMMEMEGTDDGQSHSVLSRALLEAMEIPVKSALLQPYHPASQSSPKPDIARPIHGVQHACWVAVWALTLLQLRKQQNDPAAQALPDEMIPLLIKACLFHDSGRDPDGEDKPEWEHHPHPLRHQ